MFVFLLVETKGSDKKKWFSKSKGEGRGGHSVPQAVMKGGGGWKSGQRPSVILTHKKNILLILPLSLPSYHTKNMLLELLFESVS